MPLNYCCSTSLSSTHHPLFLFPPFTLYLPSLSVPSIQRQKARLLLVCGQIRASSARFSWEGARRRPVLQLQEPIGAGLSRREGGSESKKNCKQMETLRILGERSKDGSADIWMFAFSICCLWDLFLRQSIRNRGRVPGGKKSLCVTNAVLFCNGWILHKLFVYDSNQDNF